MKRPSMVDQMPPYVRKAFDLDAKSCGCGTNAKLIQDASTAVQNMMRHEDCIPYHIKLLELELQMLGNVLWAKVLGENPDISNHDRDHLAKQLERMMEVQHLWVLSLTEIHEELIAEEISGPIFAAHNGDNFHRGTEKKQ